MVYEKLIASLRYLKKPLTQSGIKIYHIHASQELKKVKGTDVRKFKFVVYKDGQPSFCVLHHDGQQEPIIYDYDKDEDLKNNWYVCGHSGYAYNAKKTMHSTIWGDYDVSLWSIDHINRIKTDNRLANLRLANQSTQNSNRATRSDKLPPPQDLIDIGIDQLPRYVRWDNTEKKFIIEKHPALVKRVQEGLAKKPVMSCTKSLKLSVIEKYQDAMARYQQLGTSDEQLTFDVLRQQLTFEYTLIKKCIMDYKTGGNMYIAVVEQEQETPPQVLEAKRATAPNKKSVIVIPDEYAISHTDLPSYCFYKKADEKRSDGFEIAGHPGFDKEGKKKEGSWNIRRCANCSIASYHKGSN